MRILVVGAAQGLGLIFAKHCAQKGNTVYAGYVGSFPAQDTNIIPIEMDVTNEDMIKKVAAEIAKDGELDAILVTAGVLTNSDRELSITECSIADLRKALDVNVAGVAIVIKHFEKSVKKGGFFIILTSEAGSMTNIGTRYPAYSITKAGENKLVAIFRATMEEKGYPYNIYAMHPGRMNTEMGRNDAQIEPTVTAESIYQIFTGEKKIPPENGWFVNYLGDKMEI
ncbi:MAG: SDR family NAD(P)-dependent oxidoreductase [Spirochaetaceae bacterium]|jgi:NAD(P)-dependent dehydrogenase (short-subunit alcohol dehydrogenase family)|nr:SDR family NAD(P)-dependent oxidoreductase [Spirochaetaceae bacterium]